MTDKRAISQRLRDLADCHEGVFAVYYRTRPPNIGKPEITGEDLRDLLESAADELDARNAVSSEPK